MTTAQTHAATDDIQQEAKVGRIILKMLRVNIYELVSCLDDS